MSESKGWRAEMQQQIKRQRTTKRAEVEIEELPTSPASDTSEADDLIRAIDGLLRRA